MKCQKESDYQYNADQIAFYERAGWHFGVTQGLKDDVQINVVYLDSHVKTINLKDTGVAADAQATSTTDGKAVINTKEPMYYNYYNDSSSAGLGYDPRYYSDKF